MPAVDSWDIGSMDVEPHHPQVLRTDDESRLIAINLPAGEQLQEHEQHEHAYFIVGSGRIEIADGDGSVSAGPGFIAHFAPGERREVTAKEDSKIALLNAPWPGDGHPSRRDG
jgi:quercetin dioxygenase-like cupin family protein